jgi:glycosyltransferase involved in cell wall biosynthesis
MIVAFDTFFLSNRFKNVGINEYAKNLFSEFQYLGSQDSSVNFRYFVSPQSTLEQSVSNPSSQFQAQSTRSVDFPWMWRLGLANISAFRTGADILFSPSPQLVPWGIVPVAVTIHDAIPVRLPAEVVGGSTSLRAITRVAAKRAQKILTDSECSKKDLLEIYDLPSEKVSVVYLGYDRREFNSSLPDSQEQRSLLQRLDVRGPYIVHHGMVQLRKNLLKLIEAYKLLLNRFPTFEFQLVLAGNFGFGSEQIRQAAGPLVSANRLIFSGPLSDRELPLLVKGASLSVIPSLYEGFCLPMIESMASGVATIAANASCLPEVSGYVLRYFDPRSAEDMAATMELVLGDSDLQKRLIRDGLQRASQFSWQRCARETLAVLTGVKQPNGVAVNPHKNA